MMKKRIFKISTWFILGFLVFFLFRLAYSFSEKNTFDEEDGIFNFIDDEIVSKRNYASYNYKYNKQSSNNVQASEPSVDVSQKYEKTATLRAKTQNFNNDENSLKQKITKFNAIIQYEEKTGNSGNKRLNLFIGIKPEKFDEFFEALKKIGSNKQADITKVDKTSEYKKLNAKKVSLEKIRGSLIQLKNQSGKIDEFINLQNRILEIETELQDLGVELGDFAEENEFCTIKFSLAEGRVPIKMSLMHRIKVSLEWTITYYFGLNIVLLIIVIVSFFIALFIDKLKVLQAIMKNRN